MVRKGELDKQLVQVWNVDTADKGKVRVATIEQGERKPSMCEGCLAPCCQGFLRPILTSEEFLKKKFPTTLVAPEEWLKKKVPRAQYMAALAFTDGKCPYFDSETSLCTIFPNCPNGCLSYDCREDTRPGIREFARQRMKEWQAQ